jgi:predicted RNA methylase
MVARYASAATEARWYVATKLVTDPALDAITGLSGPFGCVVDLGCGFGQIGLALLELGRATSCLGIDSDEKRVWVARQAGGDAAERCCGTCASWFASHRTARAW